MGPSHLGWAVVCTGQGTTHIGYQRIQRQLNHWTNWYQLPAWLVLPVVQEAPPLLRLLHLAVFSKLHLVPLHWLGQVERVNRIGRHGKVDIHHHKCNGRQMIGCHSNRILQDSRQQAHLGTL